MTKGRLAAFNDAVIAIIMTILVLDLEVPHPISWEAILAMRGQFLAYTISFFWLGAMWVDEHNEWHSVKRVTRKAVWLDLVMLFFSSFFPFVTSLVSADFLDPVAQAVYGVDALLVTFANMALYRELGRANTGCVPILSKRSRIPILLDVGIKVLGLVLCLTVWPPAMMAAVLVTLLGLVIPSELVRDDPDVV